ncbi:MAG: Rieske 2Fe-2S domain-containing protein [Planctomycetota bacterium]|jgi:menaquinol-cytochrome c reductase iron-sulfur subunit
MSEPNQPTRRNLFAWLTYATGAAAAVVTAIPIVGYFAGALRRKSPPWINLGPAANFPVNQTRLQTFPNPLGQSWDGMVANTGVFVRNLGNDNFVLFAINCTHLGCPVTWFPQSGLFMCPCHGGVYYENGEHASGPPPRGLYHCVWRIFEGNLEVEAPHLPTLQDPLKQARCSQKTAEA